MKNLKNLGKALSKAEQQEINGGRPTLSQRKCLSDCSGQPQGTRCYSSDCSCPGICSGNECAMY